MSKLEQARKTWVGKSDEWLYERLANELNDKVQEIHRLLKELDEVKNLTISDVIERSEQLVCYICKKNPVEVEDDICKNCADESE